MSEIEQAKQAVKDDVSALAVERRKAMDALNCEQSWIEKHPNAVTLVGVVLLVVIVWMLMKAYA